MKDVAAQPDRVAIVTGSNVGLGFETAVGLAQKEIIVIMACRNLEKAEAARLEIIERVPEARLEVMLLDLNSLESVRDFAKEFADKHERLDLLINNAGIMMTPLEKTEDGFESQFGVNHLGHFLLTGLLLPLMEKTEHARVVALSSLAHKQGSIDFDNLDGSNGYSKSGAYSQSKLACLMFAYEMNRRLRSQKNDIRSVAAHPGAANTELGRHLPSFVKLLVPILGPLITHPVDNAALPTLYAALGDDVEGGDYFGPTGFMGMKGSPGKVDSTDISKDEEIAKRLWEVSEEMTGIKYL